jgi:hypothetical protein
VSDDLERDRFFTPAEAKGYGLIDRVCEMRNGNGNGNGNGAVSGANGNGGG